MERKIAALGLFGMTIVITIAPVASTAGSLNSSDGLVGYWDFEGAMAGVAFDASGHGNDGWVFIEPSAMTTIPEGPPEFGQSLHFDGSSYVEIPHSSELNITGQITLSAWIKVAAFDRDWQSVVTKGDSAWRLGRDRDTNFVRFSCDGLQGLGPRPGVTGTVDVNDGQWHHVAGVYDGQTLRLYTDGNLDAAAVAWGTIATNGFPVMIGENAEMLGRGFVGEIDEVRIYDYGLNDDEIGGLIRPPEVWPNRPPIVKAGPDQTITVPMPFEPLAVELSGTVTDDWLPDANAPLTTWALVGGQGPVEFEDPSAAETRAWFYRPGTYVLRLGAYDGEYEGFDDVGIEIRRSWSPGEQLIRNYTPPAWQAEDVLWTRDEEPHNKIDDRIDVSEELAFDVVVNFKRSVQDADVDWLITVGQQSELQLRLKYLSSVAVGPYTKEELQAIAANPDVAFVELQLGFGLALETSVPGICVTPATGGCPLTVPGSIDGSGINIVVMDSGVDNVLHQSFGPASAPGYDATTDTITDPDDDVFHGTHVASIALGQATTNLSRGVAPGAGLIDVKIPADCISGWPGTTDALEMVYDRRNSWGVDVINMSFRQCDGSGNPVASDGLDTFSQLVDLSESMGIVVVAAAGNDGPYNSVLAAPAAATRAITVAACNDQGTVSRTDDTMATFSSRGPRSSDGDTEQIDELKPEVTAPGHTIRAARWNTTNGALNVDGTSMAAPHVAGLAALIMQARPGINAAAVKDLIISTAQLPSGTSPSLPSVDATWNNRWGWGLIHAGEAVAVATQTDLTFPSHPPSPGWLSPDISTTPFPPKVGQPTTVTVKIRNNGPNPATDARIHFGVHVFSASTPTYYDIATKIVNVSVAPAAHTLVSAQWTPQKASHQCLQVEIGYGPDTDYSNNRAQRNLTVGTSPARFHVRNILVEGPARINLVATLANPAHDWPYYVEPSSLVLSPEDGPAEITAELIPPANAVPGTEQILHVAAVIDTVSGPVELGGVSILEIAP